MKNLERSRANQFLLLPAVILGIVAAPLLARAQADKPATPKTEASDKLPPAKEVISKFVKAIGGKEGFAKIQSQHAKGKFEMAAQGLKGELEVFAKRPNKLLVKITIPVIGDISTGFDGKTGWAMNAATGPMLMEGKQLEQMREQANFDSVLHDEKDYTSMETVEKTDFEGKECYKVKLVKKGGQEVTEYYDTKTGMLVGFIATQDSQLGSVTVTNLLSEYKKYGDILFATKITQKMGPIEQVMVIDSFELNKVEDSAFGLPAEIKALVEKK